MPKRGGVLSLQKWLIPYSCRDGTSLATGTATLFEDEATIAR